MLAILETKSGLAVLGVEAKVDETFGSYVSQWSDGSSGKAIRLSKLTEELKIEASRTESLRYQLLHRTVATILEARQAKAHQAVMLIQSFSPQGIRAGFSDFQAFSNALGAPISTPGILSAPIQLNDVRLWIGWTENVLSPPDVI